MLFKLFGNQCCENRFFSVLPVVSCGRRFSIYPLKTKHRAKACRFVSGFMLYSGFENENLVN